MTLLSNQIFSATEASLSFQLALTNLNEMTYLKKNQLYTIPYSIIHYYVRGNFLHFFLKLKFAITVFVLSLTIIALQVLDKHVYTIQTKIILDKCRLLSLARRKCRVHVNKDLLSAPFYRSFSNQSLKGQRRENICFFWQTQIIDSYITIFFSIRQHTELLNGSFTVPAHTRGRNYIEIRTRSRNDIS